MRFRSYLRFSLVAITVCALSSCSSDSPTQGPAPPGGSPVLNASVSANSNNTFSPSTVNLLTGGTVTFSNAGGLHNVSSGDFRCANGCDGQGGNGDPSTNGWSFQMVFPTAGTVSYVCDEHAGVGMTGQIIVQ